MNQFKVIYIIFCIILTSCLTNDQRMTLKTFLEKDGFTDVKIKGYTLFGCERAPNQVGFDYMFSPTVHSLSGKFTAKKWGKKLNGYACCSPDFCEVKIEK